MRFFRTYIPLFLLVSLLVFESCNSNKITCPTYKDSFPERKKKVRPGTQKPEMPKPSKTKSGVMPSGSGKHMHHTK